MYCFTHENLFMYGKIQFFFIFMFQIKLYISGKNRICLNLHKSFVKVCLSVVCIDKMYFYIKIYEVKTKNNVSSSISSRQTYTDRQTVGQTDGQTDRQTSGVGGKANPHTLRENALTTRHLKRTDILFGPSRFTNMCWNICFDSFIHPPSPFPPLWCIFSVNFRN